MRIRLALLGGLILLLALVLGAHLWQQSRKAPGPPIVIGLLHALSGPMATSEGPLVAAVKLAVEEVNERGGLLGRPVVLRIEDTRAEPATAAQAAARLIDQQGAVALFGCWTSACREAVRPVVEARRHLLFYPMVHEGMERSPHVLYTGPTPNQQMLPATDWAMNEFGRRVYLIGAEGPFARRANALLREFVRIRGGEVAGEHYVPLGSKALDGAVRELATLRPDLVLSTLSGDSHGALFDALVGASMTAQPLLSFTASEPEMRAYGGGRLTRHFAAWSYLQSLPGAANQAFVARLRRSQGNEAQASDPAVSAYVAVQLWAAAVDEVDSTETEAVNANLLQQTVPAPQGFAAVDAQTRRLWRQLRIARVQPDGQLAEVLQLPQHIRPALWPSFRSMEYWAGVLATDGGGR